MPLAPPPGTPPHDRPQPFLLAMRARDWAWWRPLLGLLVFAFVYVVVGAITLLLGVVGLVAAGTRNPAELSDPAFLLVTNLATMAAIPVVWVLWVAAHGMRRGWSSSVLGRLRWRLIGPYVPLALATIGVAIVLSLLLSGLGGGQHVGPVPNFGLLLVVVLLTTPLQSAAEEYLFRGYLSQAVAGWVGRPVAGAVVAGLVTAALFSLAHAPPDLATFVQRFAVGLAASAVVWLTGGLEAAIVLHAVNNVVVFLLVGALGGGVAGTDSATGGQWTDVVLTLLALSGYVALVAASRHRLRPETRTAALDLRGPHPAVRVPAG
ncbi:MAG TPA: type II CAAX endopeptidase family protein [Blastococcus sp.]